MATAPEKRTEWPVSVDTAYLVQHDLYAGARLACLVVPPTYTAFTLWKHGRHAFQFGRLLRTTWITGAGGGSLSGLISYIRYQNSEPEFVHTRKMKVEYDANRVRAGDYALVGMFLGTTITSAILWKRFKLVDLILGGAGLGTGVGVACHYTKTTIDLLPTEHKS